MTIKVKNFLEETNRFFWILGGLFALLIGSYLLLLMMTVGNVVAMERYETILSEKSSRIGELESAYLTKKNTVTLSRAHELGYTETVKVDFISSKPLSSLLSLSENKSR